MAEAAGKPIIISDDVALSTRANVGSDLAGQFSFKPLFDVIAAEQPDLFN